MESFKEKRVADRYPISCEVQFAQGLGITKDMSFAGISFRTELHLALGALQEFMILLPDDELCLRCQGEVIRVSQSEGVSDVAIEFTYFGFDASGHGIQALDSVLRC